jgi:hypothetical protein
MPPIYAMSDEWIDRLSLRGEQFTLCLARAIKQSLDRAQLAQGRHQQSAVMSGLGQKRKWLEPGKVVRLRPDSGREFISFRHNA